MSLKKDDKDKVIKQHRRDKNDTGSPEVQIALWSARINSLTEHFSVHKKDLHSRYGLLHLVNSRRKLLDYLKVKDNKRYQEVISKLDLRK